MASALLTGTRMYSDVRNDIRCAVRSLARTPVWSATLILTIAIGIGSSAAVQGFARGLLITDLPIFGIDRVVTVFATNSAGGSGPIPYPMFAALRARSDIFESLAAFRESQQRISLNEQAVLLAVASYSPDALTLFPLPSAGGVTLGPRVRFANFPASIEPTGRTIHVNGTPATIAGTMPYWLEGLYRGRDIDIWMPLDNAAELRSVSVIGRLLPGVPLESAQAAVNDASASNDASMTVLPYTAQTPETASGMLRVGALLRVAAIAVFVIACANVAAFVLARSWSRTRETAVRVAIGARRRQLLRQLLIDSVVISIIGAAAGFILASWMADIIPLMFFDQDADRLVFSPDARRIAITTIACAAITVACGLVPLFDTKDDEPAVVLQREIAGPSKAMMRVSKGLIQLQMAACAVLVISTGLVFEGFRAALDTQAGRRLGNPVLLTLEALPSPSPDDGRNYFAASLTAAASAAAISETVWAARLPGLRPAWQWVQFDPAVNDRRLITMPIEPLTEHALDRLALPPVSGRLFPTYDDNCQTVVLNEAASKSIFSGHPIGRILDTPAGRSLEVIGITRPKDTRQQPAPIAYDHPASPLPLGVDGQITFLAPPAAELESGLIDVNIVSANYFDAMGLRLVAGELFDSDGRACRIGVVNEEAAKQHFGENAVGAAVIHANGRRTEIVGVVRSGLLSSAQRLPEPTLFLPHTQDFLPRMTMVLATPETGAAALEALRQRVAAVPGGRQDRVVVTTLDDHLSRTALAPERIAATLVATFSAIAVALGALGLYGLMADAARRRQREFAMRLALGAHAWRVVGLVLSEGLRLVAIGATAGMFASLLVARWLATLVPAASLPSPIVWMAAVAVLAAAAVVASVVPARRALSVDLVSLMRDM